MGLTVIQSVSVLCAREHEKVRLCWIDGKYTVHHGVCEREKKSDNYVCVYV